MNYETILFEKTDSIALVTLNRPDKLNALNNKMFSELDQVFRDIELDRSIMAVILTGTGEKAFAAGADISELHESNELSGKIFSETGQDVMNRIWLLRKPVIAAVNGFSLGGGCELAMSCHIRFASKNAKFGQPEVNLGIIPGYGGTQRLPRLVGTAKAIELIISGNMISADEAFRLGLVNSIHEPDELMSYTYSFLETVLSKGPIAVANVLDCIRASQELSLMEGLKYEARLFGATCGTEDFKEGTGAFLEKRKPNFSNR